MAGYGVCWGVPQCTSMDKDVAFYDRGLTWQQTTCQQNCTHAYPPGSTSCFYNALAAVNYKQPPYATRYFEIVNIYEDHPCLPVWATSSRTTAGAIVAASPEHSLWTARMRLSGAGFPRPATMSRTAASSFVFFGTGICWTQPGFEPFRPPTHNPRPTAHMQHNPQYRPPSDHRARPE